MRSTSPGTEPILRRATTADHFPTAKFLFAGACLALISGCNCEIYQSLVEADGRAYREERSDEDVDMRLRFESPFVESSVSVAGISNRILGMCLAPNNDRDDRFAIFVDLDQDVGMQQTGNAVESGCAGSLSTFDRDGTSIRTNVSGSLAVDGSRIIFNRIELTTLSKEPPTFDVVLEGTDTSSDAWKVELVVTTGRSGNSESCD